MKVNYEATDTFGGEANYCWVRRGSFPMPDGATDRAVIRAVKQRLELSGVRHKPAQDYGDMIRLDFYGLCWCVFITFGENELGKATE